MTKRRDLCSHCGKPVGMARLVVRDARVDGISGVFHVDHCYEAAHAAKRALSSPRLHADAEVIVGVE